MQRKSQKQQNCGPVVADWAAPQAFWSGREAPDSRFHLYTMTQVSALTKPWKGGGSFHSVWRKRVRLSKQEPLQSERAKRNMRVGQQEINTDTAVPPSCTQSGAWSTAARASGLLCLPPPETLWLSSLQSWRVPHFPAWNHTQHQENSQVALSVNVMSPSKSWFGHFLTHFSWTIKVNVTVSFIFFTFKEQYKM